MTTLTDPLLSILIPCVPSRLSLQASALLAKLEAQRELDKLDVEILLLCDNKRRPVGAKRQALLEQARGQYVAFCDDDDDVSDDYLLSLCSGAIRGKDVVTFRQRVIVTGQGEGEALFSLHHASDEPFGVGAQFKRRPWHVCAYRRELALRGVCTEKNYGEDADWVDQVAPFIQIGRAHV